MGEIKNGKPDGRGIKLKPYAGKYSGEWKNGKEHGQGTYTFSGGRKGVGKWRKDEPWNVTYYDTDGNIKYKFVNGKEIKQ